jgi:hypothetical protein
MAIQNKCYNTYMCISTFTIDLVFENCFLSAMAPWNLLSVRHFVCKLLFHVHLPRFWDILIWIDCRKLPTTSTELGQKTARCESLRALLHYVEWDRIFAGSKRGLRVTLSYLLLRVSCAKCVYFCISWYVVEFVLAIGRSINKCNLRDFSYKLI